MTEFQTSAIGMAESALRVAGSLFGGIFNTAGNSAYEIQRAVGGKAHDSALEQAVEEGKKHFHQCTRCGNGSAPRSAGTATPDMCDGCAPKFQQELASAHAQAKADAARQQLYEKAQSDEPGRRRRDERRRGRARAPGRPRAPPTNAPRAESPWATGGSARSAAPSGTPWGAPDAEPSCPRARTFARSAARASAD